MRLEYGFELSEVEVVRHFTRLSTWNAAVDLGLYPLGSCTMKYNPIVNDRMAALPGFAGLHPYAPASTVQGALRLVQQLEHWLGEISGLPGVALQPAAGAQGVHRDGIFFAVIPFDQGDVVF